MTNLRSCILIILQITAICNAIRMGWKIHLADNKKLIFRKKLKDMTRMDHNIIKLVDHLINMRV
ncbi:MAG: hypothetical protein Hyperionvirus19_23 [Hyperionvirus sp.]|uniref:Uncharacterized protein n=1 Tax=Hyperionvirus sp. TaxID=2487770 RepID=A0A3G5AFP2_9VIRU|nr:MAG: hypothetical protein Hyperionvirus19_23 [Hyperionvirus sp.]